MKKKDVLEEVRRVLEGEGFEFESEPSIGGLRPDFLVKGPAGERVVVEVKSWTPRSGNTARAWEQAELYLEATKADAAFVVLDDLSKNYEEKGVVSPGRLAAAIREVLSGPGGPKRAGGKKRAAPGGAKRRGRPPRTPDTVFAAMPFRREFDDTFFVAMVGAAKKCGLDCVRVDREEFSGDIVSKIRAEIEASRAVIVDLSRGEPNVLYEAGYAHALGKPTVHISSTALNELPFDVRNWNTLEYKPGQTSQLVTRLTNRLRAVLAE